MAILQEHKYPKTEITNFLFASFDCGTLGKQNSRYHYLYNAESASMLQWYTGMDSVVYLLSVAN